jgi:hypothetical protein
MTDAEKRLNEQIAAMKAEHAARVSELLAHNSTQLMENRAQRATILKLKNQVGWLLDQLPQVTP